MPRPPPRVSIAPAVQRWYLSRGKWHVRRASSRGRPWLIHGTTFEVGRGFSPADAAARIRIGGRAPVSRDTVTVEFTSSKLNRQRTVTRNRRMHLCLLQAASPTIGECSEKARHRPSRPHRVRRFVPCAARAGVAARFGITHEVNPWLMCVRQSPLLWSNWIAGETAWPCPGVRSVAKKNPAC